MKKWTGFGFIILGILVHEVYDQHVECKNLKCTFLLNT